MCYLKNPCFIEKWTKAAKWIMVKKNIEDSLDAERRRQRQRIGTNTNAFLYVLVTVQQRSKKNFDVVGLDTKISIKKMS